MNARTPTAAVRDELPATVALVLLSCAAGVGLARLFTDATALPRVVAAAVLVHAVCWAGRRMGWGLGATGAVVMGTFGFVALVLALPEATTYGIPTPATFDAARAALDAALEQFRTVAPPAPPMPGFILASMVGVGMAAFLADWAAFRMGATAEACLPSFSLFVFSAALGPGRFLGAAAGSWVIAFLLFLLAQHGGLSSQAGRGPSWFASRSGGGRRSLALSGAALIALTAVAGLFIGPRLPGADAKAIVSFREGVGISDGSRTTVSPLVDIRGRLIDRSGVEVFTVVSPERAYWRLTALDRFDGQIWSSDENYQPIDSELDTSVDDLSSAAPVVQEFSISSLSSLWLPAAYRPVAVAGPGDLSFNEASASIITREDTSDGLTYRVRSALRSFSREQLVGAPEPLEGDPEVQRYTALPRMPRELIDITRQRIGGATTAYDALRSIQDWFRRDFTYDLDVPAGHSGDAILDFIDGRRGYCEQFAGTFAVMARLLGMPSRVAIGFTAGELRDDGRFHVRDEHAHAWPEVWFQGIGWVPFEPTPGRGNPGAEGHTGAPEQQVAPQDPNSATTVPATTPPTAAPQQGPGTTIPQTDQELDLGDADAAGGDELPLVLRMVFALGIVVAFLAVAAGVVAAVKAAQRRRRWRGATTPAARVGLAWADATDALALAGAPRRNSETPAEYARRAPSAAALPADASDALGSLGADVALSSYGPAAVDAATAKRSVVAATVVSGAARRLSPRWRRVLDAVDPRPLIRRG